MIQKTIDEGALLIGLTDNQYNEEIQGIRATELKAGLRSQKAMQYASLGRGVKQTDAMAFGTLLHRALADPSLIDKLVVYEGIRRGKAWDAFRSEHDQSECMIVKPREFTLLRSQIKNLHDHPAAKSVIDRIKEVEVSARWKDAIYGYGKCRFDGLGQGMFVDYKSSSVIEPETFMNRAESLGYLLQFAWYAHGYEKVASEHFGELQHAFCICIQTTGELDVCVYELGVDLMREAYERIGGDNEPRRNRGAEQLAREFTVCQENDVFQGVGDTIIPWERPYWVKKEKMTVILDGKSIEV